MTDTDVMERHLAWIAAIRRRPAAERELKATIVRLQNGQALVRRLRIRKKVIRAELARLADLIDKREREE